MLLLSQCAATRQAARLRVAEGNILRAITCGLFPEQIEQCVGNLAFVGLIAGRSPKITKPGRYFESTERERFDRLAFDGGQHCADTDGAREADAARVTRRAEAQSSVTNVALFTLSIRRGSELSKRIEHL
jgi:hypothetical protein